MKCGFFELDITPPLGSIIPGSFGARYSDEILDPLFVRAFVAQTAEKIVAVATIDACGVTKDVTDAIKDRVSSMTPIKPEDVLVMATHTHGGGPTLNWGEEIVTDSTYLKDLTQKTADAIYMAYKKAADSELYFGKEELTDCSFIRVYELKDGSLKTNPGFDNADKILKPCSTIDPDVLVLAVKQNDNFVGAIVHFTNHPATVATNQITGDYISALAAELKNIYGSSFVTVYVNGACGNINHVNPFDRASCAKDIYRTEGIKIAKKVESAISKSEVMADETLDSSTETIYVKFRKPDANQLAEAKKLFENMGDKLIDSTPHSDDMLAYIETFFALQAFWAMSDKRTQRDVFLQIIKIGSCCIFGVPAQIFVEYGKKIKSSCDCNCFVSAFSNDYCGYVPTPECMKPGVYEARLATTSCLEPAAGDKITDSIIDMYKKL